MATLTLELDAFGNEALGRYARESGGSLPDVIRLAIRYHLADGNASEAPAWLRDADGVTASERLARGAGLGPDRSDGIARGAGLGPDRSDPISVELDERTWTALAATAERRGIDPERLAEDAYLHFLADLESGRVAERLARSPGLRSG